MSIYIIRCIMIYYHCDEIKARKIFSLMDDTDRHWIVEQIKAGKQFNSKLLGGKTDG